MTKICCTCKMTIDINLFGKNKNTADNLSAQCKSCAKAYRDSHKEEKKNYPSSTKEYKDNYRKENLEQINKRATAWRGKNPDKVKAISAKSHLKNRENNLIKMSSYYQENKEEMNKKDREYRKNNKQSIILRNRVRDKKLDATPILQKDIDNLLKNHNNKCHYCGIDVMAGYNLHLDHKTPLCKNGEHNIDNLVPACAKCNLRKGRKDYQEFINLMDKVNNV